MMKRDGTRPSSYDVARLAGVSQATVSFVLNEKTGARIPETTRIRVLDAARELGYVASSSARSLATGKTRRIGFLPEAPEQIPGNGYFHRVLSGLIDQASVLGYGLLLHTGKFESEQAVANEILGGSVDAVILLGRRDNDTLTERILRAQLPMVCAAYEPPQGAVSVDIDKVAQGRMIGEQLLAHGHTRARYVVGDPRNSWSRAFAVGLHSVEGLSVQSETSTYEDGEAVRMVREGVHAVVFSDEYRGRFAMAELDRAGIRYPDEIALVSNINDNPIGSTGLSGTVEPVEEIGRLAIEKAVAILEGKPFEERTLVPVGWFEGRTL